MDSQRITRTTAFTTKASLFPTTPWTQLMRLSGNDAISRQALAHLCKLYWYPIYAYIRSQGKGPHDAEDLTQDFFVRLVERRDLEGLDQGRGKLRQFLLVAVKNFLRSAWRDQNRLKRGGGKEVVSLNVEWAEGRLQGEMATQEDPEKLFEQHWTITLLEHVLEDLAKEYERQGKTELFQVLRPFLSWRAQPPSYADAARTLKMEEGAVRVAVHRLRKRYRSQLEKHIEATVEGPEEVDDELDHLMTVFSVG